MVMKIFEINLVPSTHMLYKMRDFFSRYQVWKDYNAFFNHSSEKILDIKYSETGIPCFHFSEIDKINQCKEPIVAIDCISEGKHAACWFNQYNTNKHYIIFASEGYCSRSQAPAFNLLINYTWITYYSPLFKIAMTSNDPMHICFYQGNEYQFDTPKSVRFVSTTGTVRAQRDFFKDQLIGKIKYKNFIFRYSGVDFGMPSDSIDLVKIDPGNFNPYISIMNKHEYTLSDSLPINMYNQANFNLLVETDIDYEYGFFLTEKILKCLISGMPFVLVATPYFLKYLKQLGFYTYNELWDESYDDELDYTKRIDKVIDLCNNLDSFDWKANQSALELIALKNRSNFLNLNRIIDAEFRQFEQAISELVE
jgi:hypothetical protein